MTSDRVELLTPLEHLALTESVLDQAPVGMVVTTADDVVIWANAAVADILGVPAPQLANQPFLPTLEAADRGLVADDTARLLAGDESVPAREVRTDGARGAAHWLALRTSLATDNSGRPVRHGESSQPCLIRQLVDVTERRAAREQLAAVLAELQARNLELERSNEELTQFAYVASHDLSEPLRVIAGHVELLSRRYAGQLDDDADRYIEFAVDGCTRMRVLIEDLLRYSRAGRQLNLQTVDCADLVEAVRRDLQPALQECSGVLLVDSPLPVITADRSQLGQVFNNLIANALKYCSPDRPPAVHVSAAHTGRAWRFDIADNGIGVPAAQRQRIFRIFQRLHGREVPGTGIGLAICRKVVEQHDGLLEATDSPYGGVTFSFTIPDRKRLAT